ncbi:crotonobetainyl-CoA:carnitine CoA-transferase CaiB-like acyl-CoA transferase [Lipingzhangella halophila]|uniref:Crotonobetainyl-CoA:carnitine CoA-transferase CaiB-like acyl-CoA transferase n=1 Tax=Lipingzhangella halophila TaxID=1783352 RepID=A0A7W7RF77_9ACTN|nr:CoA transferase [Lipingzhangella halophila]MBB4930887.1 crotonobetainyl-CoA:carnitine CoA-transferase CaiB-like acyl-CoA transferase [Lipingzhangella halophila]
METPDQGQHGSAAQDGRPLDGVRVADLSRVLAGPYASMLLADMGADVVKVEHPERGDDTRSWGPPWAKGESAYFLSVNRGKRSLAVDVKSPEGRDAVRELCAGSDVVIQNFRPGVVERLGVDYEAIAARNPAVVYCSITGFGTGHEPAGRPGFDAIVQAESGLMRATGPPEGPASRVGVAMTDILTGLNATVSVVGALMRARATGRGEHVTASLVNSALSSLASLSQQALVTGEEPARYGNAHPSIVPYQTFRTADDDIVIAAGNDSLYRKLCDAVDRPDLATDPRFASNPDRIEYREELVGEITATLRTRTAAEWLAVLTAAGVPVGRVRGVLDAVHAANASGDDATMTVEHPTAGTLDLLRPGFQLGSAGGADDALPPPLLGQHSARVLGELGLPRDRIADLTERGVVFQNGTE